MSYVECLVITNGMLPKINFYKRLLFSCDVFIHNMFCTFYPRDAMLMRVIVIATCLSVRPSRAGIVSKRRKLAAWFLHHLVAPRL